MNEFDYDVLQRKRLARQSKYLKNGSRSKKCTVPSDFLSPSEKKKMNGEVSVYKMGQPISWQEFKKYPVEMQKEYILSLVDKFGCTRAMLCEIFGIPTATLGTHINKRPELKHILAPQPTKETRKKFEAWMENYMADEAPTPTPTTAPVVERVVTKTETVVIDSKFHAVASSGKLTLSGKATDIFQSLSMVFSGAQMEVTLHFKVVREGENVDVDTNDTAEVGA